MANIGNCRLSLHQNKNLSTIIEREIYIPKSETGKL